MARRSLTLSVQKKTPEHGVQAFVVFQQVEDYFMNFPNMPLELDEPSLLLLSFFFFLPLAGRP